MAAQETIPPDLTPEAVEVFCSYSHRDDALREELEKHLSILQANGIISSWHDHAIPAGKEWDSQIDEHLNSARIILLLISPDFLASKYCREVEVHRALERHKAGEATVIPVMLRDVDWHGSPLSKLQALPKNATPVVSWPNHDQAFKDIAVGIRKVATGLRRPPEKRRAEVPKDESPKVVVKPIQHVHHPAKGHLARYIVFVLIVAVLLSALAYLLKQNLDLQAVRKEDYANARFDAPRLSKCMGFPPCMERKAHSDALKATDWTTIRFDSPLLSDCMSFPTCMDREKHALKLIAVTDWAQVRLTDPSLLADCMEYDPCLHPKTVVADPKTQKPPRHSSADEEEGKSRLPQVPIRN